MRRVVVAAAILACVLGLVACGGGGDDKDSSGLGSQNPLATKGGGKTGTPLAGTDPCTLLKPADVPELAQKSYVTPKANGGTCSGYDFAVAIKDVSPAVYATSFNGPRVKALPDIAGHKAAMSESDGASLKTCQVVLEVTSNQLVTVTAAQTRDNQSNTCDIAQKAAAVVAGRIPS